MDDGANPQFHPSGDDDRIFNGQIKYANTAKYDESLKPNDIDWISGDIEAKISAHKPNNMVLSNDEIDYSATEATIVAIFAPKPGETFVWFNLY